jgi:predicted secreted hydrolase
LVSPLRRRLLQALGGLPLGATGTRALAAIRRDQALVFPRDHGAHLDARTEWWYATGWAGTESAPTHGLQLTFFRSRTGLAQGLKSRFAARQLLFAHAAVTVLERRLHLHDQRIARWSGAADAALGSASMAAGDVRLGTWLLRDQGAGWVCRIDAADFNLDLRLARTQPLLLQGDAGFSRKGPLEQQASRYLSEAQLAVRGTIAVQGHAASVAGRAWLDHEWSDEYLHPEAVGWDWIGFNLFDGSALMAFVLRRADGSALWAGGSFRAPGQASRDFGPQAVRFSPGRRWKSPASGASYPVEWSIETPAGRFGVQALLDIQELDSRGSTGTIYWEGLSALLDAAGRRVGLGYLEMTGYVSALKL